MINEDACGWRRGTNDRLEDHVRSARQTRPHTCHWPGCDRQVPPAMWGCKQHWFRLPRRLREKLWRAYRPGQEEDLNVSDEYFAVAGEVQQWIRDNGEQP